MLDLKALLAKIANRLTGTPKFTTWSNVVPTANAVKTCGSIALDENTTYLVLGRMGNGIGTSQICNIQFAISDGSIVSNWTAGNSQTASGSGNSVSGWCYVENGNGTNTLNIQSYGYNTSARFNGVAVAIPLFRGGVLRNRSIFNAFSPRKGVAAC